MNEVQKIEDQIYDLNIKKSMIKDAIFTKASKSWLSLMNVEFESSSCRTPQYLAFHRIFKKQITKLFKDNFDVKNIKISKPNHFDASGFIELFDGTMYNFFIGDLRWNKSFIIREVMSFTDYTGGINRDCNIKEGMERFINDLNQIINKVSFQEI